MRTSYVSVIVLCMVLTVCAEVPPLINYQGRLLDGTNLVNGSVALSLQLYDDASAGALLYEDSNQVAVVDGLYSTLIGDDTVSGTLTGALASAEVWIQVLVNGAEMSPREQLVSVGYALEASDVSGNVFWRTDGNEGTTAGTHFVGTTDEQPLHLRANNAIVLRLDGEPNPPNVIGGDASNYADPGVNGAFIGGGGSDNRVSDHHGVIGGGQNNRAGDGSGTVSNSWYATVGGGGNNSAASAYSFIGGGALNQIFSASPYSVIAGGYNNIARGTNSTVGGGSLNEARQEGSTVAGGDNNYANGPYAFIGGGQLNKANGNYSFSAGRRAESLHEGSFVWADNSTNAAFASTSSNQFLIRAQGGVGINTNGPFTDGLTVNGGIRASEAVHGESFVGDGSGLTMLNGTNLMPASVSNAALAADAVTSDKIENGTITTSDVAPNTFWQTSGNAGTAPGTHFVGTTDSQPLELRVNNARVLRLEGSMDPPNIIGGEAANYADGGVIGAVIAGGGDPASAFPNRVSDHFGVIGGGLGNRAGNSGGGVADRPFATVAGGQYNIANAEYSSIGGGNFNFISTFAGAGVIAGGDSNQVTGIGGTVGGGRLNEATGTWSTVSGGTLNRAAGGHSAIGGGSNNVISIEGDGSGIGGGKYNTVIAHSSFIGSGSFNTIQTDAYLSVIGGGENNNIEVNADRGVIGGGRDNTLGGDQYGVIGGGNNNEVQSDYVFIGGGNGNYIGDTANYSVICGGMGNKMTNSVMAHGSFIGGGYYHSVSGRWSAVAGGWRNQMDGEYSVIGGGMSNVVNGDCAVVPGGRDNMATAPFSFAAGRKASAVHTGAFVWADSANATFSSTTNDQFAIRATNGVWIAQDRGTNPVPFGTRFRDNAVVAWAKVNSSGGLTESFNVHTVTNAAVGRYDILLKTGARSTSELIPVANVELDSQPASAAAVRFVSIDQVFTNLFRVYINDGTFAPVDSEFTVVVFGR